MSDQDERGIVKTRSGTWEWQIKTFSSWPKSAPASRRLRFRDASNPVNTMSVRIEPEVEDFSERSVRRLSLGPLSRRFEDNTGSVWIARPAGKARLTSGDQVRRISLHSLEHLSRTLDLPPGRTLGDLKNRELVNLV